MIANGQLAAPERAAKLHSGSGSIQDFSQAIHASGKASMADRQFRDG